MLPFQFLPVIFDYYYNLVLQPNVRNASEFVLSTAVFDRNDNQDGKSLDLEVIKFIDECRIR